jgi:hypothetical protein
MIFLSEGNRNALPAELICIATLTVFLPSVIIWIKEDEML